MASFFSSSMRLPASRLLAVCVALSCGCIGNVGAQVLRLGPLDFSSKLTTDFIYTTNVEGERESDATGEMEDFYLVVALDLVADANVAPSTALKLDTGMSVERHLNREDLNNSTNPFGRANISTITELTRYTLSLEAGWERTSKSSEETAFPGESRLTRKEQENFGYSGQLEWRLDPIRLSALYEYSGDRYLDEGEEINDKDTLGYLFEASYDITRRMQLAYSYDRSRDELINVPEDFPEWKLTQRILLNFEVLEKPNFIYGFGYEKEDTGEDKEDEGQWEILHTFSLSDDVKLSDRVKAFYNFSYEIEEVEEDDDVTFTMSAGVEHQISQTALHIFTATKEPVDTFGSTTDTDSTQFDYSFKKFDLVVYNLNFNLGVNYTIDEPLGGGSPTEKIWTYTTGLSHDVVLSTRWARRIQYLYTQEDSNLEAELLEEHRVTLTYEYTF